MSSEGKRRRELRCEADGKSTVGFAQCRDFTNSERMARAAKIGGVLWLVALLCVFVPVLHFVLVPLFLLLGLVFGVATWMDRGEVLGGEVPCPVCERIHPLTRESESFPKSVRCVHCHFTLRLL